MKLIQRFGYYLGGFGIGIIIVLFVLSGKETSCSYFPNARVLKEIRFKTLNYSPEVATYMTQNQIDSIAIGKLLRQGNVDFDASQTDRDNPCRVYVINGTYKSQDLQIQIKECKEVDSIATVIKALLTK